MTMSSLTRRLLVTNRQRLSGRVAGVPQFPSLSQSLLPRRIGTGTGTGTLQATTHLNLLLHRSFSTTTTTATTATTTTTSQNDDTDRVKQNQNDMIRQYAKQGDVLQAEQVLTLMQAHSPDGQAYSAVLHAWLDKIVSNDDDDTIIYLAVERATELLFQWRDLVVLSSSNNNNNNNNNNNAMAPPTTQEYNAVLQAWTKIPHIRGVPQRAQRILELLEKEKQATATIESYNYVLQTWAHSREHMRGTMAQTQFQKLQEEQTPGAAAGALNLKPNGDSYRTMIYAWVHSGESKAAFRATGHLMKLLRLLEKSKGDADLEPAMEDYYNIFKAWTTARDKHAAEKSFNVLRLMEYAYMHRFSELRADIPIFRSILQAYGRSDASAVLGPDVDQLLEKIWDRNLVPDTECFSSAIQAYVNCALHKDSAPQDVAPLATRAHQLLHEMIRAVQKSESVQVSTENYNAVLKAYTATIRDASEPALELLNSMELPASVTTTRPNAATYALVVTVLATSNSIKDKVKQSQALIQRAQREYESGNNDAAKPDIFLYNALIRACAASSSSTGGGGGGAGSQAQREGTFRIALQTLQRDIRGNRVDPDPETFYWLLEASASLLPAGTMQAKAMEQIFTICCQSGLVDHVLLKRFQDLAPDDLYTRLVLDTAESEDDDGTRVVPLAWTCNVTTKGLIVDRKKPPSLDVDGNFFLTSKMKDRRMKGLRQRRNQKLLRGGRVCSS